jgi:hypothetical protein
VENDPAQHVNPSGTQEYATVPGAKVPKSPWDVELYDLSNDPGETIDLPLSNPAKVAEPAAHLDEAHKPYRFARSHVSAP